MPVDFPDMNSLIARAKMWKFRMPNDGESEDKYRRCLAHFVIGRDKIEAYEILFGKGWDKWNEEEKEMALSGVIELEIDEKEIQSDLFELEHSIFSAVEK